MHIPFYTGRFTLILSESIEFIAYQKDDVDLDAEESELKEKTAQVFFKVVKRSEYGQVEDRTLYGNQGVRHVEWAHNSPTFIISLENIHRILNFYDMCGIFLDFQDALWLILTRKNNKVADSLLSRDQNLLAVQAERYIVLSIATFSEN